MQALKVFLWFNTKWLPGRIPPCIQIPSCQKQKLRFFFCNFYFYNKKVPSCKKLQVSCQHLTFLTAFYRVRQRLSWLNIFSNQPRNRDKQTLRHLLYLGFAQRHWQWGDAQTSSWHGPCTWPSRSGGQEVSAGQTGALPTSWPRHYRSAWAHAIERYRPSPSVPHAHGSPWIQQNSEAR